MKIENRKTKVLVVDDFLHLEDLRNTVRKEQPSKIVFNTYEAFDQYQLVGGQNTFAGIPVVLELQKETK